MIAVLHLPGWLYAITVGIAVEAAHHKALAATALLAVAAALTRLRRGRHARLVSRPRMTLVSHGTRGLPPEPKAPKAPKHTPRHTGGYPIIRDEAA